MHVRKHQTITSRQKPSNNRDRMPRSAYSSHGVLPIFADRDKVRSDHGSRSTDIHDGFISIDSKQESDEVLVRLF